MKFAVFPGSFDPITSGHYDIIQRAKPLFDKIYVSIGINSQKKSLFPLEQRINWLHQVFDGDQKVEIGSFEGLTVNYCRKIDAHFILRGIRNSSDFDYEKTISQLNKIIGNGIETLFLISRPEYSHVSSTIVREIIKGKGDVSPFLPLGIDIKELFKK